ncbi:MAG TPA: hypothetical protein VJN96_25555 [Vicinamibacterales bacterium]|nr:hypothetical protein [Vicinamibacterales bacterium]
MRRVLSLSALVLIVAVAAACSSQKDPADAAIKSAQSAFSAVSAEAQKYVPDQAKGVQDALTAAQTAFTNGDYAGALTQAQALPARITALGAAISAKKAELTTQWNTMSAGIPKVLETVKTRVDTLSKSKGLPKGMTKDTLTAAQSGLASATQTWQSATSAASSGDLATAIRQANDVKTRLGDLLKSLNMPVPPGIGG